MEPLQIVAIILASLLIIDSGVLVWAVMKQKGTTEGLGSIMDGSNTDSFLGRNKTTSAEGKLALVTKVSVIIIVALALALSVIVAIPLA